jgi:hypothetical protein
MAHPAARGVKKATIIPGSLQRPLTRRDRRQVEEDLVALLAWQRDLVRWRKPTSRVDALPYVALYSRGKLYGCFGAEGGEPGERLARAFLRSLNDTRFGGLPEPARAELAAEVYYVRDVTVLDPASIEATFEPGTHGLGVVRAGGVPVVLLPSVARDNGYKASAMLEALVRKARVAAIEGERFFTFEVDRVVGRMKLLHPPGVKKPTTSLDAAAAWLARLVQKDGSVLFAIDARTGSAVRVGEMHHARVAAAVQALALHGGHPAIVSRARKRLARDAEQALAGSAVESWPQERAKAAGTLAHLLRAGVDLKRALLAMAGDPEVLAVPWHAGQVAAALGGDAPDALVRSCVAALETRAWAPWTVLALANRPLVASEDFAKAVGALVASVRTEGPHRGGVRLTPIPEVALTALTVEALRSVRPTRAVREAIQRGAAFVSAWQVTTENAPAAFALDASVGAFVGSPIASGLRADITAHAYLALA